MTADRSSENESPGVKPRLHGELLSTSLLAFLKGWNAYGYQLSQRLAEAGMPIAALTPDRFAAWISETIR
jgi:hypothetical protein